MKKMLKVIGLATIILSLSESSSAKDWRGIIPLHSTRDDVIRLLGPSPDANNIRARYSLEKEDVYIVFSSDELYLRCTSGVPKRRGSADSNHAQNEIAVVRLENRPKQVSNF